MSKLSLEALKQRAEAVVSEEMLASISGGEENACHDSGLTGYPEVDTKLIKVEEPVTVNPGTLK